MVIVNSGVIRLFGLTSSLFLAIGPGVWAQSEPGWQDWQPIPSSGERLPFQAGFSNTELGGHLDYQDDCEQRAREAGQPLTYWYRLNDLVRQIGTGVAVFGCQVEGQFVETHASRAVQAGLKTPVCLRVQSDMGNGLRVRQEPKISSRQLGTLRNGEEAFYRFVPALIIPDSSGRQWINVQRGGLEGWASLRSGEGEHVNFRLCPSDV